MQMQENQILTSEEIAENLRLVEEALGKACEQAERPVDAAKLIAVSKTKPAVSVEAALEAGQFLRMVEDCLPAGLQRIDPFGN